MSLKAAAAPVCFCFVTPFFHFNVLMCCQRQFSGFWHRRAQTQTFSLFFYQHSLFTTPLSHCHSHLSLTHSPLSSPLVSPLRLPGERCPGFSHDRSVPCRFELHILRLFKVTDCCMPNSPLKHSPMSFSQSLQYKAHTIPTDQTPSYPYKLYQRIARNKYEGEKLTSCHRAL